MLIELEVLIPLRDNFGRRFARAAWGQLEVDFAELAGGLSKQDGIAGQWSAAGRTYRDVSRRYLVAIRSWRQFPAWLEIVERIIVTFHQEAVYIRVGGGVEILERQR